MGVLFVVDVTGEKSGLKTAVAALHDPAAPVPGAEAVEQLEMLPLTKKAEEKQIVMDRRRGRPPGAKNKNTQEWRDYLLSRYSSPLEALAQTYSLPVEELRTMVGGTLLDAYKLQLQAAKELAPYLHQKMPLAIDTGDQGLIQLTINMGAQAAAEVPNAHDVAFTILNTEDEQNQLLESGEIENSNDLTSNENQETPENKGQSHD